jgi:hypothetical protein
MRRRFSSSALISPKPTSLAPSLAIDRANSNSRHLSVHCRRPQIRPVDRPAERNKNTPFPLS